MKLNNKGFAITGILYGLLILFVFLVGSYLLILNARKNRIDNIVSDLECDYFENCYNVTIYKVVDGGVPIIVDGFVININESKTVTISGGRYFNIDSVSCDNEQTATVVEIIKNDFASAKFTIENVTHDTNCIIYMES